MRSSEFRISPQWCNSVDCRRSPAPWARDAGTFGDNSSGGCNVASQVLWHSTLKLL